MFGKLKNYCFTRWLAVCFMFYLIIVPGFTGHAGEKIKGETTWQEINEVVYGAKPDEQGPLGGGKGYLNIVTSGNYTVKDIDSLLKALSKAEDGQVVFIPGNVEIDLTTLVYIEKLVLEIPGGVTLASDRGHNGSQGALLMSDTQNTSVMLRAKGPDVRITGLRIQGPNPKQHLDHHRRAFGSEGGGHEYYYKFPTQRGIVTNHNGLEVDNCEISGFGHGGIYLQHGEEHHIHHNFIHHCQYHGLGYGVVLNIASAVIEFNLFDWNRHSIAGTGRPGCSYVARHNVELGIASSHCFDMHGGRDRRDKTNIAGTSIKIYNNTFYAKARPIVIRGVPEGKCRVYQNWFVQHTETEQAVRAQENTYVFNNIYGRQPQKAK